jgi:hypothetical protein
MLVQQFLPGPARHEGAWFMTTSTLYMEEIVQLAADAAMEIYRDGRPDNGERAQALFIELLESRPETYHLTRVEQRKRFLRFAHEYPLGDIRLFESFMRNFPNI